MDMGANTSTISKIRPGIVVTLDAQGTIYKFREPISRQYLKVAERCGLKDSIEEGDLDEAFRKSFKGVSADFPNYGKNKLSSPRAWWKTVVNDAFRQVVDESKIPEHLGEEMYDHFTSSSAYELYPDVKPFFASMRELKSQWSSPDDPPIMIGVISNSDPRVKRILQSLGLRTGIEKIPSIESLRDRAGRATSEYTDLMKSSWHDAYDPLNDIDFVATSYYASSEKPDEAIFRHAEQLATLNFASRIEQRQGDQSPTFKNLRQKLALPMQLGPIKESTYIHIGDEYKKDYLGAINAGFEAMHLIREGEGQDIIEDTTVVPDLESASTAIRIMVNTNLSRQD